MISSLGILTSGDERLILVLKNLLSRLASIQTPHGHIPSLASDPTDCGASDTTPLFLIALALYRQVSGEAGFLGDASEKALTWMRYQSPDDSVLVAQQPTSDWRDEQWVYGYGLYVNALYYACLRMYGEEQRALDLKELVNRTSLRLSAGEAHLHEGLALDNHPYYALYAYKIYRSSRYDLLGNSLAVLFGLADPPRAAEIIDWTETACHSLRASGSLACELPPCLMPFIQPTDEDWLPRYQIFGQPGHYHNGGIWPFIAGFYVAAITACGKHVLAQEAFDALTRLVRLARSQELDYGFNEWICAGDNHPCGHDWQTWSAAMYLYAASCIEQKRAPFFQTGAFSSI
jgi:hypothetical protein